MSTSEFIKARHLSRLAIVYVRQSSPHQTMTHQESLQLQYELAERARAYGWPPSQILIIDADLGRSGRSSEDRPGFQDLVSRVSLEQAGILFAYDATRLARNCTDWYQLLDLCGWRDCLVGDQETIYDPATPNGRLILGLKGLISELELHTLRARLTAGLWHKAQRGELAVPLPVGLERDALGQVLQDANQEVQSRLELVFASFLRLGSIPAVVRFLDAEGLLLPRRSQDGVVWRKPAPAAVHGILSNPAYAGAFVYGRTRATRVAGAGSKTFQKLLPQAEWKICIRDKYAAYIDWPTYEKIQTMMRDNYNAYRRRSNRGAPRAGAALLQGLVYCGQCGHKLVVHYGTCTRYVCDYFRQQLQGEQCQHVAAAAIDAHVARLFLEALAPAEVEVYERALADWQQRQEQVHQASQQQLERLRYQARLAERQFHKADPDNRLVTAELEKRWEAALRDLQEAEQAWQRQQQDTAVGAGLDAQTKKAVADLGGQLAERWHNHALSVQQKKALIRCLIDKVVVRRAAADVVETRVVWKGGETTTAEVAVPVGAFADLSFAQQMEEQIAALARQGKSDAEIAECLTRQGYRSAKRATVPASTVQVIRLRLGVYGNGNSSYPRRVPGFLTIGQIAEQLNLPRWWIYQRLRNGTIQAVPDPKWHIYLFPARPGTLKLFRKLRAGKVEKLCF